MGSGGTFILTYLQTLHCQVNRSNHEDKYRQCLDAQNEQGTVSSLSCKDLAKQLQRNSNIQHYNYRMAPWGLSHHSICPQGKAYSLVPALGFSGYCRYLQDISSSLPQCRSGSRILGGSHVWQSLSHLLWFKEKITPFLIIVLVSYETEVFDVILAFFLTVYKFPLATQDNSLGNYKVNNKARNTICHDRDWGKQLLFT